MASQGPTTTYSLVALEKELKDITPYSIHTLFATVKTNLQSGNNDAVKTSANALKGEIDRTGSKVLSKDGVSFLNKLRIYGNLQESNTMDASAGKTTATPIEDTATEAKKDEMFGREKPGNSRQQVGSQTLKPTTDNRPPDPNQQINMAKTLPQGSSVEQMKAESKEKNPSQEVLLLVKKCLSSKSFELSDTIRDLPKQSIGLEIITEIHKLKDENKRLAEVKDNKITTVEEELKTAKSTIESNKGTLESNKSTIESNKSTIDNNKITIEKLEKEKKDEEDKNKQMLTEMETKYNAYIHQQEDSINQLQSTNDQLHKSIAKLEDKLRKARKETEGCKNQLQQLDEDSARQQQKTSEEIRRLHGENKQLKSRVSELAGAKLMDNNPDIADLSDPNRAMKLGEKFSSLYDDDWTDAFQSYTEKFKMKEDDAIQQLLQVLMKTYEFCRKVADEQMDCLCNVFDNPCQDIPKALTMKPQKEKAHLSQKQYKDLKDLRKQVALKKADSLTKQYVSKEYEEVKKGDKKLKSMLDETRSYYEKCVDVCWPMVLHDPPVRMDPNVKPGVKIDQNRFRLYGGNGDILEYLVWPPLLVEGGGLLAKGVAKPQKVQRVMRKP